MTKTSIKVPIPPLSDEGVIIDDPIDKANLFNKFFTEKSQVNRPNDIPPNLEKIETLENLENIDTTRFEIGSIIKKHEKFKLQSLWFVQLLY